MGALQSKKYGSLRDYKSQLKLNIQIGKKILPQFMILEHWSFQQIRSVYQLFARYSGQCPFIDSFIFHKIMPFSGNISRQLFLKFVGQGQKYVSIYELICTLILLSYNTYKRKLQLIYLIFDFNHEQQLKMKHFVLIYESMYTGYLKITNQNIPSHSYIKKYLYQYYLKSQTLEVLERNIQFRKLIQQVQGSSQIYKLFMLFQEQSIQQKKQSPNTLSFAGLKKYDKQQSTKLFRIIKKVCEDKNYEQVELVQKNKQFRLDTRKINCVKNTQAQIQKKFQSTSNFRIKNRSYSLKSFAASFKSANKIIYNGEIQNNYNQVKNQKDNKYHTFSNFKEFNKTIPKCLQPIHYKKSLEKSQNKLSTLATFKNQQHFQNTRLALQSKIGFQVSQKSLFSTVDGRKKLQNQFTKDTGQKKRPIIFLNGKTHSKKQIFSLIDYFRSLSNNKQQIKIKQFFKMFDKKSFLKKQLTSFFRYFDKNKNGLISFQEFIKAYYPGIQQKSLDKIYDFYEEYKEIYNAATVFSVKKQNNKTLVQLPAETTQRIEQIFNVLDSKKKGFLQFQDIKTAFTSYSIKEVQDVIKNYGVEGKLYIDGVCRMLLPQGWSIQGCNWHIKSAK